MKKKLRILLIAHPYLMPPEKATEEELEDAPWRTEYYVYSTLKKLGHDVKFLGVQSELSVIREAKESFKPHIAFNLLEEFDGEGFFDHNVVSYLELIKLPYTGCNPKGLLLCRDKALSKKIVHYHRVKVPQFAVAKRGKKFKRIKQLEFPLIVKSLTDEGSCGISQNSIVSDDQKLNERIKFIHESIGSDAIIESYIEGKEIYATVMGNKRAIIPPLIELEFKDIPENIHKIATSRVKWNSDYRKKYKIDIKVTKNLEPKLELKIKKLSKKIYKILSINGYARIDLRVKEDGTIYFIEANPNPDIANGDEVSLSNRSQGTSYPELLEKIIKMGLEWRPEHNYH